MSIRNSFRPLCGSDAAWRALDMSTFVQSTWDDLAAADPPFIPCGKPNGGVFVTKNCTRSNKYNIMWFGYDFRKSTPDAAFVYKKNNVPPRNKAATDGSPALEFWCFKPKLLDIVFELSKKPVVWATRDDWEEGDGYEQINYISLGDNKYRLVTQFAARSILIDTTYGYVSGTIISISTK